jgi:hypothetical protein
MCNVRNVRRTDTAAVAVAVAAAAAAAAVAAAAESLGAKAVDDMQQGSGSR